MKELSLHILDIVQNAITAEAKSVAIEVTEDTEHDTMSVEITDDGCGMNEDMVRLVRSPFVTSRTTRKVGMGIPLFREGCLQCEGTFTIVSKPGIGTMVRGCYKRSHIDRQPLGDIADTVFIIIIANPEMEVRFRHRIGGSEFSFDTGEVRQALGGVPLDDPDVSQWIREHLNQGEKDLHGGVVI